MGRMNKSYRERKRKKEKNITADGETIYDQSNKDKVIVTITYHTRKILFGRIFLRANEIFTFNKGKVYIEDDRLGFTIGRKWSIVLRKERLGDTETIPVDNETLKNYLAIKEEKGVEKYEWLDNDLPMDASFGERLRESGELSRPKPAGRYDARNGTNDGRTGERNPGGASSKTTESTQVDRTDAEFYDRA